MSSFAQTAGRAGVWGVVAAVALTVLSTSPASASPPPLRVGLELHGSFLSNQSDRSILNVTFGGGIRMGYREDGATWGGYLFFEQNAWYATELFSGLVPGVRNVGVGIERLWPSGLVRTSMTLGVSILAYDTALDDRGTTGVYFDLRPASLRWEITRAVIFELTPIHLVVVAPVVQEPVLVNAEYRTTLGFEFVLR